MYGQSVTQPIRGIDLPSDGGRVRCYTVDHSGVTRIEAIMKPGLHCDIPYVRVWKGDLCEAEFCQHNIVGVYFAEINADAVRLKAAGIANIISGICTTCGESEAACNCLPF